MLGTVDHPSIRRLRERERVDPEVLSKVNTNPVVMWKEGREGNSDTIKRTKDSIRSVSLNQ